VWPGLLRVVQRLTHHRPTDLLEFRISFSVRDLLAPKGRAVKDQVEALVQAVQKAGSYQAKDEAARAVHAVMDALKDRVPPDVLMKLSESLPVREAARLRRAATQRTRHSSG
jgi:ABC-type nitrate/sulfonate/bicarbonate transport system substrate-binding protein